MNSVMKLVVFGLVSALCIICLPGCGAGALNLNQLEDDGHEIRIYEVFGMDCPGCHGGLEKLINQIPGVKASQANWEKGQLKVVLHLNMDVEDEAIQKAIKSANFTPSKRIK